MYRRKLHPVLEGGIRLAADQPQGVRRFDLGSPAAPSNTAVLGATAAASSSTVTTGLTNPDVPRVLVAKPGGTTANILAVSVVVTGKDYEGNTISETLPAFTAASANAVTGLKAFKSVTSVALPASGTAVTVSIGTGPALGLPRRLNRDSILNVSLGGVTEATRPTIKTSASSLANNTVQLASTLNGSPVVVDAYGA
jgi:hypothetical protein